MPLPREWAKLQRDLHSIQTRMNRLIEWTADNEAERKAAVLALEHRKAKK